MFAEVGAVVLGRRTFEVGRPQWGDTPYPVPCFVLTHHAQPPIAEKSGTFTFVADGAVSAVTQARAAADGKSVIVHGRRDVARAARGRARGRDPDHLIPVLLGDGVRLFDDLPGQIDLERLSLIEADNATHLRFRVRKPEGAR